MLRRRMGRTFPLAIGLSLIATSPLAIGAPALAQPTNVYGGSGGRFFEYGCGNGQVLVGLRGSAGILLDNIQAICGRVGANGTSMDAAPQGPVFGGNRASDRYAQCPPGYAVSGASMGLNENYPHIGAILLTCTELVNRAAGGSANIEIRGSGNLEGHEAAPPIGILVGGNPGGSMRGGAGCANYAVGIRGRAQDYLDAFGLVCGQAVAVAEPGPPRTLNKRRRSSIEGKYPNATSTTTSIPQVPKTLNKRRRPGSWGTPAPEQQTGGAGGASLNSDGSTGAYTKGNGWTGAPPATPPAEPPVESQAESQAPAPSADIGGSYSTVVEVNDSRCLFRDMRGSSQRVLELAPNAGVMIPLHSFSNIFGGPVTLNVDGLRLSQSTTIQMVFGPASSPMPATFDGAFTEDGEQFNVNFKAGNNLCRVAGTIRGQRQN